MASSLEKPSPAADAGLLIARLIAGGAFLLAGWMKLRGGPVFFAASIESFKLLPDALITPAAYFLPWFELVLGAALVLGVWTRQAGLLAMGLYLGFTFGLVSVIARGMEVDCGCFGGFLGGGSVGWESIARNGIFIVAAAVPMILGPGRWALEGAGSAPNTNSNAPQPTSDKGSEQAAV